MLRNGQGTTQCGAFRGPSWLVCSLGSPICPLVRGLGVLISVIHILSAVFLAGLSVLSSLRLEVFHRACINNSQPQNSPYLLGLITTLRQPWPPKTKSCQFRRRHMKLNPLKEALMYPFMLSMFLNLLTFPYLRAISSGRNLNHVNSDIFVAHPVAILLGLRKWSLP